MAGLGALLGPVLAIAEKVIPDPAKRREFELQLEELADREDARLHEQMQGQVDVNKIEAAHRSVFVAGWRPAIGWVGALSLLMFYPVQIAMQLIRNQPVTMDIGDLLALIGGLLGFGWMRSQDKAKGVANDAPLGKSKTKPVEPPKDESPATRAAARRRGPRLKLF